MHENLSHLLWNMGFLWLFGPSVEDAIGSWFFTSLYLGGGVAAGLLNTSTVMLFAANQTVAYTPLVGASGAVSAVLGVFAVRYYRSRLKIYWAPSAIMGFSKGVWEAPALLGVGAWLAQNMVLAIVSLIDPARTDIAYWAHIGGFVFGVAIAQITDLLGEGKKEYLLHEARAAIAKGDNQSECVAINKYRLTLQRRPDDKESRRALADMALRHPGKASPVRARLSEAYSALIEHCFTHYQPAQAIVWVDETTALAIELNLTADTFTTLAAYLERRGSSEGASRMYERLIQDYPDSPEARAAYLELASLHLNRLDHPAEATSVLREYLQRAKQRPADRRDNLR